MGTVPVQSPRFTIGLLLLAAFAPYLPILSSSLLMDSHVVLPDTWKSFMHDGLACLVKHNLGGGVRPLSSLSIFATAWFYEANEIAHRVVNYAIHGATTLVVWRVALRLGLTHSAAVTAAILFAWSPGMAHLVPWIAGRPDMLAGLAAGLLFLAWTRYRESQRPQHLALVYLSTVFLLGSKEHGVLLPPLLILLARGQRLRFVPLLVLALVVVYMRMGFHATYPPDIQREYSPFTPLLELERLGETIIGAGKLMFSLLTCSFAPWEFPKGALGAVAAVLGLGIFAGVAAKGFRRSPLALAFATALLVPVVPFMHKAVPAYLYAATVFLMPMLVQTLARLPDQGRRALCGALMATSLLGGLYNVYWWNRASNTYRREVEALRPVLEETIEECRASRGRVHAVEVLGLTPYEGPVLIFTPGFSPYSLNYAFFPFYRTTDPTDEKYMQSLLIHWRGGRLTELEEERLKAFGGVRKTVPPN